MGEDYTDINAKDVDVNFLPIIANKAGLQMFVRSEVFLGEKYEFEYNCNTNDGVKKINSESAVIEVICPYKFAGKNQFDVKIKVFGSKESNSYAEVKSSGKFTLVDPEPTPSPTSIPTCGNLNPGGNVGTQPLAIDKDINQRTEGNIVKYCEQKYPGYKPCVHVYRNQGPTNETLTRYECGLAYK